MSLVAVGTAVVVASDLGPDAIKSIRQWWKGEISAKACAQTIAVCVAGQMIGKVVSSLMGLFFDQPKGEALKNAYEVLGVSSTADIATINSQYKKLALKYHPDKPGGSQEKWLQLRSSIEIIRNSIEKN